MKKSENKSIQELWAESLSNLADFGSELTQQLPDPENQLSVAELYRHMFLVLSQGYGGLVYQDPRHPDFWPQFSTIHNFAIDNVDDAYYTCPLDADGVYKVTGYRGSSFNVDFQIGSEHFFYKGLGKLGPPIANYHLDEAIEIAENGYFEVILSETRPSGYEGNWLYLDSKATHLFVRQVFYDWDNEVTGRFAIDRIDIPANRPRDTAEDISAQLSNMDTIVKNWVSFVLGHTQDLIKRDVVNRIAVRDFSEAGGVSTQTYMDGLFKLSEDEALLLEVTIPDDCYYWSFVIYDELWAVIDWMNRQSSINGRQAWIDDDGKFRAIISAQDPGVPNWLDTAAYQWGGVFGRFNRCPGKLNPQTRLIKIAEVRNHLPENTPTVSPEQRDESIRARRKAIQMRRRW